MITVETRSGKSESSAGRAGCLAPVGYATKHLLTILPVPLHYLLYAANSYVITSLAECRLKNALAR